jgi:hypothetical protein
MPTRDTAEVCERACGSCNCLKEVEALGKARSSRATSGQCDRLAAVFFVVVQASRQTFAATYRVSRGSNCSLFAIDAEAAQADYDEAMWPPSPLRQFEPTKHLEV